MLARVFKIDAIECDCCGGKLRPISAVTESALVRRYLKSLDIDYEPPPRGPPRYSQDTFDFEAEKSAPGERGDPGPNWSD